MILNKQPPDIVTPVYMKMPFIWYDSHGKLNTFCQQMFLDTDNI